MKKLLYVPIIHMEADLGSLARTTDEKCGQMCGKERWTKHKKAVSGFWDALANYFDLLDASNLKIYQDGLVIDGEIGKKIVEKGASEGSKNYQIILKLMERGAEIRKTEDILLLRQEYDRLIKLTQTQSFSGRMLAYMGYKLRKGSLMEKRDKFIAARINETLQKGETGVLFLGVYHNVIPRISQEIRVYEVKNRSKVKAYFDGLISGKDEDKFNQLAEYLASPVKKPSLYQTNVLTRGGRR